MTILVVDNNSPFTRNISDRLAEIHADFSVQEYCKINRNELLTWNGFILSGRRTSNKETNVVNTKIILSSNRTGCPLLGICYGAEILAMSLGGSLMRLPSRIQGEEVLHITKENELTMGSDDNLVVYESHGFVIAKLPPGFSTVASSDTSQHEILRSGNGKMWATQFHPEKSGQVGLNMISNFVKVCETAEQSR